MNKRKQIIDKMERCLSRLQFHSKMFNEESARYIYISNIIMELSEILRYLKYGD